MWVVVGGGGGAGCLGGHLAPAAGQETRTARRGGVLHSGVRLPGPWTGWPLGRAKACRLGSDLPWSRSRSATKALERAAAAAHKAAAAAAGSARRHRQL